MDAALWIPLLPLLVGFGACLSLGARTREPRVAVGACLLSGLALAQALWPLPSAGSLRELLLSDAFTPALARTLANALAAMAAVVLARSVHERNRAEELQWGSMEAVRALVDFFSAPPGPLEARLEQLLAVGCKHLELRAGAWVRHGEEGWEPLACRGFETDVPAGLLDATASASGAVACERAICTPADAEGGGAKEGSWLATAVRPGGRLAGVLAFGEPTPRPRRFGPVDRHVLGLMSHWLETELTRHGGGKQLVARRDDGADRRRVDVNQTLQVLEPAVRAVVGDLRLDLAELPGPARIYRHEFDRVLWSLVGHAAGGGDDGAAVTVSTTRVEGAAERSGSRVGDGWVTLSVAGGGAAPDAIAAGDAPRLATRAAGLHPAKEAMLTLARIERLLKDAGGDLSVETVAGVETRYTAWLPLPPRPGA